MAQSDRTSGLVGNTGMKQPVRAATTANITLSGLQTVDGVVLIQDDRVLVKNQTTGANNGIWVADTGTWERAKDWDGSYDIVQGTVVRVNSGTQSGFWYVSTADPIVIGTTALTIEQASSTLAVISAFMQTLLDDATAAIARATLGSTTVGDAVFVATTAAVARLALGFAAIAAKGDSWWGTAADTIARKAVGSDGQIVVAQASQSDGVRWADYTQANLLINPNWLIDQINEGALYTVTGGAADVQTVDGWSGAAPVAPGVFKVRRLVDPDNAALTCLEITCTTADAAIAAADAYYLHTAIEGYDATALLAGTASAQAITISFKFKSTVTGVYGISLANSALNRSYVGIFTVANANEASYTLTLTLDTTGTWLYTDGVGLRLRICLAAGTNFQKAAGSWGADNMLTTSAQANFMSDVVNVAQLKRIQLIPGSVALPLAPADIQKELAKCQRYYWKTFNQGTAVQQGGPVTTGQISYRVTNATAVARFVHVRWAVPLRANPSVIFYNPNAANALWRNQTQATDSGTATGNNSGSAGASLANPQVAGDVVADIIAVHATANARLT